MLDEPEMNGEAIDPEHERRFLDLVRGALTTPVTDTLKEEEREYEREIEQAKAAGQESK